MIRNLFKRWMYAQMYGANTNTAKKLCIAYFLWKHKKFKLKASLFVAFNPTTSTDR